MSQYWKLLNWEINRFIKLYAVLGLIVLLSQGAGLWFYTHSYLNRANTTMLNNSMTAAQYGEQFAKASFLAYSNTIWFLAPIYLSIAALLLYVFAIWYREWFGKSTFIYRLLMLPTSRGTIYFAKMSAIGLFVLGLVAFQIVLLVPELACFNSLIPSVLRDGTTILPFIRSQSMLNVLLPKYFIEFLLYYGAGLLAVTVLFTAILFERSFKLKGIFACILYGAAAGFVFIFPVLLSQVWYPEYFFPSEIMKMEIAVGILILCSSFWLSFYLLKKRITV